MPAEAGQYVFVYHKDYAETVTKNFEVFLDRDLYVDLIFVCKNNQKVGAHQIVLGCLSKFFYNIFIDNLLNAKEKVLYIHVPDIRSKILKSILRFVYSGKATLNQEELAEFNEDIKLLGMPLDHFTSPNEATENSESSATAEPNKTPRVPSIVCETVDLTDSTESQEPTTSNSESSKEIPSKVAEASTSPQLPTTSSTTNVKAKEPVPAETKVDAPVASVTNANAPATSDTKAKVTSAPATVAENRTDTPAAKVPDGKNTTNSVPETQEIEVKTESKVQTSTDSVPKNGESSRKRKKSKDLPPSSKRKTLSATIDLDESDDDVIAIS